MTQLPKYQGDPSHRANSLIELLSFNDVDFVDCAYVTMLGRQADENGRAHHVQQIRLGVSKLALLWQLRQSHEGRQHDPGIAKLHQELKRASKQRRPFMGAISRFLRCDSDGSSRSDRSMRVLINATFVNQRYLQTISERVTVSWGALQSPVETISGQEVDPPRPLVPSRLEVAMTAEESPELDHLRRGRQTFERSTGGVAQ